MKKRKEAKQERKQRRGRKRGRLLVFLVLFLSFFTAGLIGAGYLYRNYGVKILELREKAKKIAAASTEADFKRAQTSLLYDTDGELITAWRAEKDVYYLEYKEIPETVVQAMLVTEDKKFYEHKGVDYLANLRAAYSLIKHKGVIYQGGSTITQQLARNIYLSNEVTYERKITEIFVAAELEKRYSKQQILEYYLNNIYFANGYYGIQAAAHGYFSKSVKELTVSELVFLCAIPNNPTLYNPFSSFEAVLGRRDSVLEQMYADGVLEKGVYEEALQEEIILSPEEISHNDYVETFSYYCATRALMKANGFVFQSFFADATEWEAYEELYQEAYAYWQKQLFTGGYRIYTSIDLEKQSLLQESLKEQLSEFTEVTEEGIHTLQGAAVCLENETGRVVAIVGGRGEVTYGYSLNRAYQSFRQPGSSIKPLIVYTPLFERGYYPDTIVVDEKFEGGPRNANGVYSGELTIRRAVEVSKNTVAWRLFTDVLTPQTGLDYLFRMNFSKIVETDFVPAASLGGLTYGVSPLEMAGAYLTLAHDGVYREPTCIVRITDSEGRVLVNGEQEETRIYEQNAARMMTDVLQGVMTNGTGSRLRLSNMVSAGKTGTTNDIKDGWFVGYTPYYTTSVWVGYDMPQPLDNLAGNTYPGYIWKSFMEAIHKGLPERQFVLYEDGRLIPVEEGAQETEKSDTPDETSAEDGNQYLVTPEPDTGWMEYDEPWWEGDTEALPGDYDDFYE